MKICFLHYLMVFLLVRCALMDLILLCQGWGKGWGCCVCVCMCVCSKNDCISSLSLFSLIDTPVSYFSHSFKIKKKFEIWRKLLGQIMEVWKARVTSRDSVSFSLSLSLSLSG